MRSASRIAAAAVAALLLPGRALALPARNKADIPDRGGVAVAIVAVRRGRAAVPVSSGEVELPAGASTSGVTPVPGSPTVAGGAGGSGGVWLEPCARRKFGGTWGDTLSFCAGSQPGRGRRSVVPPAPAEVALALADRARVLAPRPRLELAPGRLGLTGLPSYFWTDEPAPIAVSAAAAGAVVTARALAVRFEWGFGDGAGAVTRSPGVPWSARRGGSIRHVYQRDGERRVALRVVWEARWRVGAGPWRPLGTFTTAAQRTYRVRSVVSLLVPASGS